MLLVSRCCAPLPSPPLLPRTILSVDLTPQAMARALLARSGRPLVASASGTSQRRHLLHLLRPPAHATAATSPIPYAQIPTPSAGAEGKTCAPSLSPSSSRSTHSRHRRPMLIWPLHRTPSCLPLVSRSSAHRCQRGSD
jgi:hypothetical protein